MASKLNLDGQLELHDGEALSQTGPLKVLALDRFGQVVGSAPVDEKGGFSIPLALRAPADLTLVAGPDRPDEELRKTGAVVQELDASGFKESQRGFRLKTVVPVHRDLVLSWLPHRVCVSGHVRKIDTEGNTTQVCPVPFVKVEIFDVDREGCWWEPLRLRLPELLDRRVLRIPDLVGPRPLPDPPPLPPQPIPLPRPFPIPRPQPDPAPFSLGVEPAPSLSAAAASGLAGEVAQLDPALQERLSSLTLSTRIAPWTLLPLCFYSRALICTTTTDEEGYFRCCFDWWPIHLRRGRLRFDWRPDIIVRVTQVVDGVEQVLYLDPYTSTRWNVDNAHIDLYLDDERVVCGDPDSQQRPTGTQAFFTRIGHNDEVFKINQANGLYEHLGVTNAAYGNLLRIFGQFGTNLSKGNHYYRLSWAPAGSSSFTPITRTLGDVRVDRTTNFSESHKLGPYTVNGQPALYEIRDFDGYLWYHADLLALWDTRFEQDQRTFRLRLEVFDKNGVKLGSGQVDYLDGTVAPPTVLPPTGHPWADLVVHVDNKPAVADLTVPAAVDPVCGVVPWSPGLTLDLHVKVSQENGRLHDWGLTWKKGVTGGSGSIQGATPPASLDGHPASVDLHLPATDSVSHANLVAGLTHTCAFSFHLWAYAHVRNGDGWLAYDLRGTDTAAIAVEKCS